MKLRHMDSSDDEQDESDAIMEYPQEDDDAADQSEESDEPATEEEEEENETPNMSLGGGLKKVKLPKLKADVASTNPQKNVATAGTTKKKKYPVMEFMVTQAIVTLNERNGSSWQAISKYMKSNWPVDDEARREKFIRKFIKAATLKGDLKQVRYSFKVSDQWKKKEKMQKEQNDKKAKERVAGKMLAKQNEAKEKIKAKEEKKSKKEATKKMKPPKDKKPDSTEAKPPLKSKTAAKVTVEAAEAVTTKKPSEKKAKIRKSIGTLRPDIIAKPSVKRVKKVVAGSKIGKKIRIDNKAVSESSDKENEQLEPPGLEPVADKARTKKPFGKPTGKAGNRKKKIV